MEGGRKRQEAAATSGRRRAKAEQDPGAAERRRVKAEQDGAAERARAWEATLERRRVKAEQEAAAARARAPGGGRRRQAREDPLARATTARDALEAREAREAAADYSRMRAEREAVEQRERVRAGRQRAIAEKKAKEEEARRKEEEIRQKEEEARIALQKLERETRELTRRLRQLEMMEKEAKEKLDKEKQEAGSGGGGGGGEFGPRRWPTREEFQDAMQKTQYDRNKFHIAIVGGTGSGKSSLINAFRNLRNKDPGAARAGMAGTTLEIGRYPEPGTASAGQCIVWYDFPGAGTQRDIPDHDLFVRQGLFVFDLVLLAIGDRFAEIDARIVEDCARFQIPVFIVWSKADMHILNLMKEYGDYVRAADNPALYAKCRDEFISQTQRVVSAGLAGCREKLPAHEVYVVSRDVLQRTYNGGGGDLHRVGAQHDAGFIHEGHLSRQLLAAAAGRRCDAGSGGGGRRGE
ncbi:P-loop containing nucleoside triphosphate hydrolase protein, partial [Morchella snyderi]